MLSTAFSLQSLTSIVAAAVFALVQPQYHRPDPSGPLRSEVVIRGEITKVVKHSVNGHAEVHIIVKTSEREVEVHIAPAYYLNWREFQLPVGVQVEVAARKAAGEPHFIARTIQCGARSLALRGRDYRPLWKRE
jgi:hypothetical protein